MEHRTEERTHSVWSLSIRLLKTTYGYEQYEIGRRVRVPVKRLKEVGLEL